MFWKKCSLFTEGLLSQGLVCFHQTSICINISFGSLKGHANIEAMCTTTYKMKLFVGVLFTCGFVTVFLQVYESPSVGGGPKTGD